MNLRWHLRSGESIWLVDLRNAWKLERFYKYGVVVVSDSCEIRQFVDFHTLGRSIKLSKKVHQSQSVRSSNIRQSPVRVLRVKSVGGVSVWRTPGDRNVRWGNCVCWRTTAPNSDDTNYGRRTERRMSATLFCVCVCSYSIATIDYLCVCVESDFLVIKWCRENRNYLSPPIIGDYL